jgi:thioesterase domain-containing protein
LSHTLALPGGSLLNAKPGSVFGATQHQRIADGLKPYNRIEQFATHYLKDLRQVQAGGPYHLGGGCEGAYIAYEMATRLQQEGQEIGSLTMWIPPPLQSSKGLSLRRAPLYHSALRLQNLWAADAFRGANRQSLHILLQHEGIEFRFHQALCAYSPSTRFQGEIALVRTEVSPPGPANINQQWIDLATNGAVVNVVPGSHGNWLHEHLDNFVNVIRKQLSTAENGP